MLQTSKSPCYYMLVSAFFSFTLCYMDPRFWGKYTCQHDMTRVRVRVWVWDPHRFRPTIYLHNHTDNHQYTRLAHGRKSCHETIFHYYPSFKGVDRGLSWSWSCFGFFPKINEAMLEFRKLLRTLVQNVDVCLFKSFLRALSYHRCKIFNCVCIGARTSSFVQSSPADITKGREGSHRTTWSCFG